MHKHPVYDTDTHFIIDPKTRAVSNPESKKTLLMQNDHNSERFSFEINRYVEGHDLTLCDKVEIHYINADSTKKNKSLGVYEVTDVEIITDKEDTIVFTWLISENATLYAGTLNFLILFACTEKGEDVYRWNSGINTSIVISKGMNNGEAISEIYPDILTQWKEDLYASVFGMQAVTIGPVEPKEYPYIWFDTSNFIGDDSKDVGQIVVKDANGNKKLIYPYAKLAGTDGSNLIDQLNKQNAKIDNFETTVNNFDKNLVEINKTVNNINTKYILSINGLTRDENGAVILHASDVKVGSGEGQPDVAAKLVSMEENIESKAITFTRNATLLANGWSSSAPYTQTVSVADILVTDSALVDVVMSSATNGDSANALLEAWNFVGRVATFEGSITAWCYEEKPTVNIELILKVVR